MCGIFAVLNYSDNDDVKKIRQKALSHSKRYRISFYFQILNNFFFVDEISIFNFQFFFF